MRRRQFLASTGLAAGASLMADNVLPIRLGIDLFSIRSSNYSAFESLDYCARFGAKVVHFSEIRFLGSLEDEHVRKVKAHADKLGIAIEAGMRSICPTSAAFDPKQGTAEEQLARMVRAAQLLDSKIVRCFLGFAADRGGPLSGKPTIEQHIENTVKVLKASKSRIVDAGIKVGVENHGGDMQGRELKMLIEAAGPDYVGAVIDSGNPLWALEDPHVTLEAVAPYILTSHVRDSALWRVPEGIAVAWTRMGEGNVDIDRWVRRFAQLCPGKALSMEIIVTAPRVYKIYDDAFWDGYRNVPAWSLSRFLALAEKGKPLVVPPVPKEQAAQKERDDLEASIAWTKKLIG